MKQGLTLVECLIVIAIIGLIVAVALPFYVEKRTQKNTAMYQLERGHEKITGEQKTLRVLSITQMNGIRIYNVVETREYTSIINWNKACTE